MDNYAKQIIDSQHLIDGKYTLKELVNLDSLRQIFEKFTSITGFTTGLVSYPEQEILISTGWRDICTKFHRVNPLSAQHCKESNVELTERLRELKNLNIRLCANGLYDGATPIIIRGVHIASLATGQALFEAPDIERFKRQAQTYGYPVDEYLTALGKVPVVSETQFRAALIFLSEIATMIVELGLQRIEEKELAKRLGKEVIERTQIEDLLRIQHNIAFSLSACPDRVCAAVQLIDAILSIEGIDCAGIYSVDARDGALSMLTQKGVSENFIKWVSIFAADSAEAELVRQGKPVYWKASEPYPQDIEAARYKEGLKAMAVIPVMYQGKAVLSLNIASHSCNEFSDKACAALEAIAAQIGGIVSRLRIEEDLGLHKAKLETILRVAPVGIGVMSRDRIILQVNDRVCEMSGYSREELIGRSTRILYASDEEYESVGREKFRQIEERGVGMVEARWRKKDGTMINVLLSSTPLVNGHSGAELTFTALDITESRSSQEQLQKSEELFRSIYEQSPLAIALFDAQGKQFHVNKAQWEIFGIADLESIRDYNLFNEIFMTQEIKERLYRGETVKFETRYDFEEIKRRHLYNTVRTGAIYIDLVIIPRKLSGYQGGLAGYLTQVQDITIRKQAVERLSLSEERYARAQEVANVATWDWDISTGVLHWSSTIDTLFGFRPGEFGRTYEAFLSCVHPEDRKSVVKSIRACLDEGRGFLIEHRVLWSNGSIRWIAETGDAIRDSSGKAIRMLGIVQDITERKTAQELSRKLSMVVEQNPSLVLISNTNGEIEYVNPRFCEITGFGYDEVIGKSPRILKSGYTPIEQYSRLWQTILEGKQWNGEMCNRKKNGELFWVYTSISAIKGKLGEVTHFIAVMEDVTVRKEYEKKIEHQANYDILTDLPNRVLAYDRLLQAITRAQRQHTAVAVMYLDLDKFKLINDTLGHSCGDELLVEVSKRLRSTLRESDTVARLSSDEFVIILPDLEFSSYADIVARKILDMFAAPFVLANHEVFVTIAIGVSVFPHDGDEVDVLMRNADAAMNKAKSEQRNTVRYFTQELNQISNERMEIATRLRYAVEKKELIVHYQPFFDSTSGVIHGVEALIRWKSEALGLIFPDRFISIAEETGVIVPIGRWVLHQACQDIKRWQQELGIDLKIAVNVSSYQLRDPNFLVTVKEVLGDTGLSPKDLELEITEHLLMDDAPAIKKLLDDLHALDLSLAIDDFGIGYSALSYLKKFPFNTLKIDRSFINDALKTQETRELTKAIISMAHGLKLRVIAEGVETQEQWDYLKSQNCDYVQGFYFSRAVPSQDLLKFIEKHKTGFSPANK